MQAELLVNGPLFALPAGAVSTSIRAGFGAQDYESRASGSRAGPPVDLSRDRGAVQANLDIPVASRSEGFAAWLGTLSLNVNAEIEDLSDFGTLRTYGYGLNWSPIPAINLIASVTDEDGAPSMQLLGAPLIVTPNVPTFDYVNGRTVDATRIDGGNAALNADNRHVLTIGAFVKPFENRDLSFHANYVRSRTDDPVLFFPAVTAEIEAAFPDRFARDASGRLLSIDARPVNFDWREQEELRWGLSFSRPLAKVPPGAQFRFGGPGSGLPANLPPGATVIRAEAGSALANRAEAMMSRAYINVTHRWHFQDEIAIRPGLPTLDLLDGSAIGARGGQPRHEIEVQTGVAYRGLGGRISGNWRSGTHVDGLSGAPSTRLDFSDYATVNLNLFANLGERMGGANAPWWARGTRVGLNVNNLFNNRPEVRDGTGAVPFNYQPAFLDPIGRSVTLSLRKLFR